MTEKQLLRSQIKTNILTISDIDKKSDIITERVLSDDNYKRSDSIFVYLSTDTEPATDKIINDALSRNKKVYVPKCISKAEMIAVRIYETASLVSGMYGIREPGDVTETVNADDIDIFIIPCVAASRNRKRLGHGAGYYDRFLSSAGGVKMCLCLSDFIYDDLPADENDIIMDLIITDKDIII